MSPGHLELPKSLVSNGWSASQKWRGSSGQGINLLKILPLSRPDPRGVQKNQLKSGISNRLLPMCFPIYRLGNTASSELI